MKPTARPRKGKRPSREELEGLKRALDNAYALLRERARSSWERHHDRRHPADAHVSVRIAVADKAPDFDPPKKPKLRPLVSKARKAKKKISRTKRAVRR